MAQPNVLQTYFTAVDLMSGPMTRMQIGLMRMTASAHQLQTAMAATNATLMMVGTSALMAGAAIAIPLGLAAHEAMKFEKAMTNVATLVDTTKESMQLMGDEVLNIAKAMPLPIDDLTKALYQIRSAGVPAEKAMETLNASAMLATAGLGSAKDAADMITSVLVDFKKEGLDAAKVSDVLFKAIRNGKTTVEQMAPEFGKSALAAAEVGVTFKELIAMTAGITNTGVKTAEAQTEITGALIALNKRTTEMITIQQELSGQIGITGQEFIQWAGGAVGAMKQVSDYADAHRLSLFPIYGRKEGALASGALIKMQKEKVDELYATIMHGNSIQEAFNKQQETAAASMERAKNQLTILGIRIGGILLPALVKVGNAIIPVIEGIGNFAREHQYLTALIVGGLAAFSAFAIAIGSISLAMSAVIKSMVMWKMLGKGISMITGINTAIGLMGVSFWGIVAPIGAAVFAFTAFASLLGGRVYDSTKNYDKLLVQTKDGMKDLVKPTEQATIALNDYIKTWNDFQETKNFRRFFDYEREKDKAQGSHGWELAKARVANLFAHPIQTLGPQQNEAPRPSDFPGLDPTAASKVDSTMNVYVNTNVDKNGNSTTSVTNNGNIPINIRHTGTPH